MTAIETISSQAGLTVEQTKKILNVLRATMMWRQQSLDAGKKKSAKECELRARGIQNTLEALGADSWWDVQYALNELRGCDVDYDDFALMMHTLS